MGLWHNVYEKVEPHMVRIETQDGAGSGFLFTYNKNRLIAGIATAAHVVKYAHDWRLPIKLIHHMTGSEIFLPHGEDRFITINRRLDSATILMGKEQAEQLKLPPETLPLLMEKEKYLKVGVEVGWVGFPSVAYPQLCFFTGPISAWMQQQQSYLIDGVAINGVSGGPVFANIGDEMPMIIGTISAYISNRVGGDTLPGLLRAQDIAPFQESIQMLRDMDEAQEKKEQEEKEKREREAAAPAEQESGFFAGEQPPAGEPALRESGEATTPAEERPPGHPRGRGSRRRR